MPNRTDTDTWGKKITEPNYTETILPDPADTTDTYQYLLILANTTIRSIGKYGQDRYR